MRITCAFHFFHSQGPIRRNSNFNNIVVSASNHTDAVPFDSSSDEEDDVIVGQTLAEINTPSMHFESDQNSSPPLTEKLRQLHDESRERLKSVDDEQSDASSVCEEEADDYSEDEREFQRIRDMEERYSAKTTPKTGSGDKPARGLIISQCLESKNSQEEAEDEIVDEKESKETEMETKESDIDPIPELIERVMEQFTPKPQVPPQIQTDFMEIVQNSLKSFENDALANEQVDTIITDDLPTPLIADESIRMTFSFEPNHILNPENIAKAFFDAMNSTNITFASGNPENLSKADEPEVELDDKPPTSGSNINLNAQQNASIDEPNDDKYEDLDQGDKEVELEHTGNASPSPVQADEHNYDDDDYDNESYYDTQFEYQITSKTPSCFNSEDYVFHANFIRPTPTTDKLR